MSEEQPPPLSLRLKPRTPAVNPTPAALPPQDPAASPAPEPPAPVSQAEPAAPQQPAGESLKFRLKPKTPPPDAPSFETPQPFSNPPVPVEPPAAALPPVAVPASEPQATVPAPTPPPPAVLPIPAIKPPPAFRPAAPQHLPTPRSVSELPTPGTSPLPTSAPPERAIKADKWLAAAVVLLLVIAGATYGVRYLFKANPKPKAPAQPAAVAETKPAPAATTPAQPVAKPLPGGQTKLVEKPQSAAGKAVARARDTIAAVEQRERAEGATSVLSEATPEGPTTPRASTPPNGNVRPQNNVPVTDSPAVAPATAENVTPQAEPVVAPSASFRQFVTSLRVNGVFQGANPRAMLNGKMYNVGAEVDAKLAIVLFKIEPEAKQLIFRDDTGAIISRHY